MQLTLRLHNSVTAAATASAGKWQPEKLAAGLSIELERVIKKHLRENYATKPNKLGAASTGWWQRAIQTADASVAGSTATLTFHQVGVALHYYGGTVKPSGRASEVTGKPVRALAIPVHPAAHGKAPAEIRDLIYIPFKKGGDTVAGLYQINGQSRTLFFILRRSATIPADKNILPPDLEQKLAAWLAAVTNKS